MTNLRITEYEATNSLKVCRRICELRIPGGCADEFANLCITKRPRRRNSLRVRRRIYGLRK